MPDRDPALEAVLNKWMNERATPDERRGYRSRVAVAEQAFTAGYDAAFRSLGAVTPEAQAALRELVTAARLVRNTRVTSTFAAADEWVAIPREDFDRVRQLAQLATPPEEADDAAR